MSWSRIALKSWDRLATYLCFIGYGVASIIKPTSSLANTPPAFALLFNVELILAGVLLIIAVFYDSFWCRVTGYVIYSIGMITISGLILIGSSSPVALLLLGFAFQGLVSIRYVSRDKAVGRELAKVAGELRTRGNDGP